MKKNAATPEAPPADAAGFERFQTELARLVAQFEKNFKQYQSAAYDEASVRQEFLDPLFRALGWDVENKRGLIPQHREVELESRTEIAGRQKRADYLFRTDRQDRFVCEAKKPAEKLHAGYAFQAKRYAWNKGLVLAVLSDFEEMKIYLVGSKPHPDEVEAGEWKTWHFLEYAKAAPEIWNLLSRDAVAGGSIEKLVASLPRKPARKTKAKQQWLFKPDRARAIDADFLDFLDEARRGLASDLIRHNDRADLLEGTRLDEAVQRILDRLLFLRICEDRDIDTGRPLANILKTWRDRKDTPLWRDIVAHFRALDRRPASHIPYFNGNLFKEHFSETLDVGDEWISGFLEETGDEASAYLFNVIPVEILGTIYERFLGKTVRPHGRGVVIEEKPEVRKAGGVYYTPRYIVDYIVEQTLGNLLEGKSPQDSLKLRVLDPACGSGSFLIRAYERLCEHWQIALTKNESLRRKADCWTDPDTGDVHLTSDLKRRILTASIYGVDLDPGAVEVSQLSLYLKMLEGESRTTLAKNRELFGPDVPLLPPLQDNVKCGNSLIASDFSVNPDDLTRVRAFDWPEGFREIMQAGGFDAVIGNPPYGAENDEASTVYLRATYSSAGREADTYALFMEQAVRLARPLGFVSMIVPTGWYSGSRFPLLRRFIACQTDPTIFINLPYDIFADAWVDTTIFVATKRATPTEWPRTTAHTSFLRTFPKRHAINSVAEFGNDLQTTDFAEWFANGDDTYLTYADSRATALIRGIENRCVPFSDYADIQRGVTPFHLTESPTHATSLPAFNGTVRRYSLEDGEPRFIRFDDTLAEPKPTRYFQGPRLLIRELISRQFQVQAVLARKDFVTNKSMQSVLQRPNCPSLSFLLGCFNSRLLSWLFLQKSNIAQRDDFPKIVLKETRSLPFPRIDLSNPSSRARHDKLVALVDKMLLLVPKLRSAKSEGDRATLQNAVSATDRAIDALVYELYGLTAEEIALVEGNTHPSGKNRPLTP